MELIPAWQTLLLWSSGMSVLAVIATLVGVPWVVSRLPADYFSRDHRAAWHTRSGTPFYADVLTVLKNTLGFVLVVFGAVMLVTPGQGTLTILAGLLVMNFPGKYRLERWLVMRPGVLRGLNWLRRRHGQPPFEAPHPQGRAPVDVSGG